MIWSVFTIRNREWCIVLFIWHRICYSAPLYKNFFNYRGSRYIDVTPRLHSNPLAARYRNENTASIHALTERYFSRIFSRTNVRRHPQRTHAYQSEHIWPPCARVCIHRTRAQSSRAASAYEYHAHARCWWIDGGVCYAWPRASHRHRHAPTLAFVLIESDVMRFGVPARTRSLSYGFFIQMNTHHVGCVVRNVWFSEERYCSFLTHHTQDYNQCSYRQKNIVVSIVHFRVCWPAHQ